MLEGSKEKQTGAQTMVTKRNDDEETDQDQDDQDHDKDDKEKEIK